MTVLERKALLIQKILNTSDQDFEKLEQVLKNNPIITQLPGQCSMEELKEGITRGTKQYYERKYSTHEQVKKRFGV